ncbi:MAG: DUF1007 family protein [Cypionkella sp.]|nr:DUF1007 family protein [Cypionkella sp.]
MPYAILAQICRKSMRHRIAHCGAQVVGYIALMRAPFAPLTLALTIMAAPALAHPHMFLDTAVEVMFGPSGTADSVMITWVYDDLSSLQYTADLGLDMDGDGALTPDEKANLTGFDMNWDAGFPGDSYALLNGAELALSRPRGYTADYKDGRIITTHIRDLSAPVPLDIGQTLTIQTYDPRLLRCLCHHGGGDILCRRPPRLRGGNLRPRPRCR